ncbi:MAG TPA: hypothetical protein VF834_09725 [Streptosporangiaceae bacterium]
MSRQGRAATGMTAWIIVLALTGCGTGPGARTGGYGDTRCRTAVRGVLPASATLTTSWLPAGFHQSQQGQSATAIPTVTYLNAARQPNGPRIMLNASRSTEPLNSAAVGGRTTMPVTIEGHPGLVAIGPPDPDFLGVYWKPSRGYLLSAVGYRVPASVVVRVARHVVFRPPGVVTLPLASGPVIPRPAAIAAARRTVRSRWPNARASLSSWTEISALLSFSQRTAVPVPADLRGRPWRPVWAVLLTGPSSTARSSLVVVDAATGHPMTTRPAAGKWFAALTDRAAATGRCPGGSSARVPFGVLTRDEETYVTGDAAGPSGPSTTGPGSTGPSTTGPGKPKLTVRLVLSTIPAVNRADPGLYGGCVQVNCSLDQLVWVVITTVRAAPGHTVQCLPPTASYPSGYHPKKVRQYYSVSVPDNYGIGCGPLPGRWRKLKDLAPA